MISRQAVTVHWNVELRSKKSKPRMLKIILAEINIMQFIYVAPWQVRSRSLQERRREHLFSCWPVSVNLYIIYRGMK